VLPQDTEGIGLVFDDRSPMANELDAEPCAEDDAILRQLMAVGPRSGSSSSPARPF
jgi:hypothetical protein